MNQPLVTVNILTWNRKADLERLLNALKEQSYSNLEVIAVSCQSAISDRMPRAIRAKLYVGTEATMNAGEARAMFEYLAERLNAGDDAAEVELALKRFKAKDSDNRYWIRQ